MKNGVRIHSRIFHMKWVDLPPMRDYKAAFGRRAKLSKIHATIRFPRGGCGSAETLLAAGRFSKLRYAKLAVARLPCNLTRFPHEGRDLVSHEP